LYLFWISTYTQTLADTYATGELISDPQWLPAMEANVQRLKKKLGGSRLTEVMQMLRAGQYRAFARAMLVLYYDKLYDRHIKNAEGTGSGAGERGAELVDVVVEGGEAGGAGEAGAVEATTGAVVESNILGVPSTEQETPTKRFPASAAASDILSVMQRAHVKRALCPSCE
jgi:hypothetical protein